MSGADAPRDAQGLVRFVGDVDAFFADHFGRAPHHCHRDSFEDLLSLDDVDDALTGSGLRRPSVRLVRDGEMIDPAQWTRRARTGSTWIDDLIEPGKVMAHFAEGATIALQSLHRWWPPVSLACRALELDLGHAVQANAYLTPAGAAGFAPHHDTHDVLVVQVSGTKDWVLRDPIVDAPLARHASDHDDAAARPVRSEVRLRPGDCLYLPRGHIHSARTQDGASLHITIGILATTVHDLLGRLVDLAADEARFRRSLPVGFGRDIEVAEATVKEVVSEWTAWLAELDTAAVADAALERFAAGRKPLLRGQLAELLSLHTVGDGHRVRLRDGTVWQLRAVPPAAGAVHRVALVTGDRRVEFPAALEPALRRLLDGTVHEVAQLGDLLDESSRAVLVRRLIREGVLVSSDQ